MRIPELRDPATKCASVDSVGPTWVTIEAAARLLQKSPGRIRQYARMGLIRSRRSGERGWMKVAREDVLALEIESGRAT